MLGVGKNGARRGSTSILQCPGCSDNIEQGVRVRGGVSTGACGQCAPKAAVVAVLSTSIDLLWRNPVLSGRGWLTLRLRLRLRLRTGVTNPMWGRYRLSEWRELLITPGHCQCSMFTRLLCKIFSSLFPGLVRSTEGLHTRQVEYTDGQEGECVCAAAHSMCAIQQRQRLAGHHGAHGRPCPSICSSLLSNNG